MGFFSNIYGGVFLLKVINYFLTAKSHQLFLQKSTNIDFSFCCEYESWQYCQKNIHLKDISPVMLKLYYYPADFILSHESEKRVTERSRLDFWRLFFNCGTQSLIPPDWAIENDLCQILCMILQFFVKERGLRLSFFFFFLWPVSPKLSKTTKTCPNLVKWMRKANINLPEYSKMTINFELFKVSKMTSLKIYVSPVMEKLKTSNLNSR